MVLILVGKNPLAAYVDTITHTFGTWYGFSEVIVRMTPLLFTAMAVSLPAKVGLINVGGEGQLYMGAWLSTWGAITFMNLSTWILHTPMIVLGFVGGGLWAAIAGYIRARDMVNETITTLLMNYVAPLVVGFYVFGSWRSREPVRSIPTIHSLSAGGKVTRFLNSRVHLGFFLALFLLFLMWYFLDKTKWGLQIKAIGGNPEAAKRLGINIALYTVVVMFVAGGIARSSRHE